ncbi:DUF4920 domain-containing protein [Rubrivirga sp. IMCC45206]|uniref:DUF4920 domain-containing protein n=1 Tax=Rubrivirga sp. IMCC45206 TaxID=3391614 RepID=UPI0039902994
MSRLLSLLLCLSLAACASDAPEATDASTDEAVSAAETDGTPFGEPVPAGDALSPDDLAAEPDTYAGKSIVVEGTVREVCQMAGCWLTLAAADGQTIRVEVPRDETESYVYTFPKDIDGQTVRLAGMLAVETESVADLQHYAQDAGASQAEIDAITAPRQTMVLTATGAELATGTPSTGGLAPA